MWDGCSRLLVPEQGAGTRWSEGTERTNERLRLLGMLDEICYPKRMSAVQDSRLSISVFEPLPLPALVLKAVFSLGLSVRGNLPFFSSFTVDCYLLFRFDLLQLLRRFLEDSLVQILDRESHRVL